MANKSSQRSQYFAAFAAAFGAMAHSTAVTWAMPTGPVKINDLVLTDEQVSWVGPTLTFAAGSMCIVTGFLTSFIGRRTAMLLLVIPFTFGWTLIILAKSFSMVIMGRALLGVATGGVCVLVPIYIGEIAEPQIRGILGSLFQLLSTVGTLFVYIAGDNISTSRLTVVCAAIPLIFGVLVLFCPESPTYLMQKDRPEDACKVLLWLRGKRYDPSFELKATHDTLKQQPLQQTKQQQQPHKQRYDPSIELRATQAAVKQQPLQQTEQQQQPHKQSYDPSNGLKATLVTFPQQPLKQREQLQQTDKQHGSPHKPREGVPLWSRKNFRPHQYMEVVQSTAAAMLRRSSAKALSISYGLFTCQQMCGINILVFYTMDIFSIAGSQLSPALSTAVIGVVATFFSALIVDRFGRRNLLLTSQIVITVCTFSLGYYFRMYVSNAGSVDHLNWLPLSMLCLFTVAFSIGLGPVPWVMLGELFPPDIKGLAGSISTSSNLTLAFISRKTFESLSDVFGVGGVFWLYTFFSLLGIVFVYFVVPETMGKSLNNIQQMINEVENSQTDSDEEQLVENGDNLAMKQLRKYHRNGKSFTL